MIRDLFRKFTNGAPASLDQVGAMETRKLPVPGLEGTEKFVQFKAARDKEGFWTVSGIHNLKSVTSGLQKLNDAYSTAIHKHTGQSWNRPESQKMNFDDALLILKDLEASVLAHTGSPALGKDTTLHYSVAEKLLPAQFLEGLETILKNRNAEKGALLVPKDAAPAPQPPKGGPALN